MPQRAAKRRRRFRRRPPPPGPAASVPFNGWYLERTARSRSFNPALPVRFGLCGRGGAGVSLSKSPSLAMASRRRPKKRARAARGIDLREILRRPRMPQLEQHQLDLIGLGLVALAAFFTFVFYLGWDGGKLGGYMADGFIYLFGGVGYLAPLALFGTGARAGPAADAAHRSSRSRPARLLPGGGLMLGLAARSFGLGPGARRARRLLPRRLPAPPRRPGRRDALLGHAHAVPAVRHRHPLRCS